MTTLSDLETKYENPIDEPPMRECPRCLGDCVIFCYARGAESKCPSCDGTGENEYTAADRAADRAEMIADQEDDEK